VELISKNTSLYDIQRCGNKYFCNQKTGTQYCGFSKAQHTLPEDGPIGPKHVGANIGIF